MLFVPRFIFLLASLLPLLLELSSWSKLALSGVTVLSGPSIGVLLRSKFVFGLILYWFQAILCTLSSHFVFPWCPSIWQFSKTNFGIFCLKMHVRLQTAFLGQNEVNFSFWGGGLRVKYSGPWPSLLFSWFFSVLSFSFSSLLLSWCSFFALLSWKGTTSYYWMTMFFLINPLFLFWFPGFVCLWIFVSFFSVSLGLLSFDYINTAVYSIKYVFHLSLLIFGVSCLFASRPLFLFCFFYFFLVWHKKNITVLLSQQCKL